LRDGVKSLMQSVELIRTHGLKSRMDEPQVFITKVNRLSMEMTQTRRKKDGGKARKRVLREMKRVVTVVRGHAQRYRTLLEEHWQATDWSRPGGRAGAKAHRFGARSAAGGGQTGP
jgi:hypothetical protein